MLATISFEEVEEKVACNRGLEAAIESLEKVELLNLRRQAEGLPFAEIDIALHVGEVLYGNVGAADRLDFTVIGPAVNEVVRIEKLCDMLDRRLLFSSRFAEAAGRCDGRREFLGQFKLRGVGEFKEIFGLRVPHMTTSVGPGLIATTRALRDLRSAAPGSGSSICLQGNGRSFRVFALSRTPALSR